MVHRLRPEGPARAPHTDGCFGDGLGRPPDLHFSRRGAYKLKFWEGEEDYR